MLSCFALLRFERGVAIFNCGHPSGARYLSTRRISAKENGWRNRFTGSLLDFSPDNARMSGHELRERVMLFAWGAYANQSSLDKLGRKGVYFPARYRFGGPLPAETSAESHCGH